MQNTQDESMLTVVAAAAIARSCLAGNKADVESGSSSSAVVGEYLIIEPGICMAIYCIGVRGCYIRTGCPS